VHVEDNAAASTNVGRTTPEFIKRFKSLPGRAAFDLSLEEKPALGFVAEASLPRGGRGNFPADQFSNDIPDEVAVLEGVRAALAAGRAQQALTLLDGLELDVVSTTFAEERLGLRVIALSRAGLHDAAATLSTTFFARYPNSLLTARVQDALGRDVR
jgi:hypothetical protein